MNNLPDGVTATDLPGNSDRDIAYGKAMDKWMEYLLTTGEGINLVLNDEGTANYVPVEVCEAIASAIKDNEDAIMRQAIFPYAQDLAEKYAQDGEPE